MDYLSYNSYVITKFAGDDVTTSERFKLDVMTYLEEICIEKNVAEMLKWLPTRSSTM